MGNDQAGSRYQREEEHARKTAASWIGHPEVRSAVEAVAPAAGEVVSLLQRHLVDQINIMRFCWRVCGIGARYTDGTEEPNPFDPDGAESWPLTDEEWTAAGYIAAFFHQRIVVPVATDLAEKGVDIDPGWAGDQAVIAVLLLLTSAEYDIPWDGNARELANQIQPPGVSAISRDGREISARDGRTEEMVRNVDAIRKLIRSENGGRDLRAPYAGNATRTTARPTRIRREVIAEIYADHPDLTVAQLVSGYDSSERRVGGRLRITLTRRFKEAGLDAPEKPSQSTLYADFAALNIPTGSGR
ncbi:hypothetical protein [Kitasatospora griseola]|uniref:hypothetical protein n=1 Tax=Kitasatospora griseola TaxID=2064 RepID=UPI00166FD0DA|nr:hypothetical protein [Kitasatospora griseola]GGR05601.1 hypothetical protein GCM10010195_71130 [Kitasatospora griseola]